jgi:hypothetical protein
MPKSQGPIIFSTIYTVGVVTTYALIAMHDRVDSNFVKFALPFFQILVTTGAIFSAWGLQSYKRKTDAVDAAEATADAVLAVVLSIDRMSDWVVKRVEEGKAAKELFGIHAAMIEEEVKVLSGVSLSALKPPTAAVGLVDYRRFARQFVVVLRRYEQHDVTAKSKDIVVKRRRDVRLAEKKLRVALGRKIPDRLNNLDPDPDE